ncbi:DNA-directed RNA polymerase subunit L [Candidatus Woesearchaeota archaeon]|jgi:DNA-directed RNA polymerase subunit L|nr:DNA-directed RNA polymerase subunit L [Candidatus Woesearchaeota archaeon]
MEINILEDSKNKLAFEIIGESHSLCNSLKSALWKVKGVKISGYNISHPLVGQPKVIVETESGTAPKKAVAEACKLMKKDNDAFIKAFNKSFK